MDHNLQTGSESNHDCFAPKSFFGFITVFPTHLISAESTCFAQNSVRIEAFPSAATLSESD